VPPGCKLLNLGVMLALSTVLLMAVAQDPLAGQLPKNDLGVAAFLQQYPEYNGQKIRVAVLDTGIDPGHPFLQTTPDGQRKIVDWYDATTDGRMIIEHRAQAIDGKLLGLSGRQLSLGKYAGAAEYGMLRVDLDFLPDSLEGRIQGDRRQDWKQARSRFQEAQVIATDPDLSVAALETKRRFEKFSDEGPVWDALVFNYQGERVLVIDNDEDGDLGEEPALRSFRESGDWATLGDEALLNYAVGFEGVDQVMLYFDAHGHGTHVAGIIGAYQGENGRMNGIAPGVEFVSIKIGDGKFGGSTSGFSITKALDYAVEVGCQVANMSFGGPSFYADGLEPDGWILEAATRRGLCVVTSAGNEGPALTTVGAPATTGAAFSIAAAIWPATQRANYSSLNPAEPLLFDFSSRGPLPNGAMGIDFSAPGAALSTLPSWGITKGENWNGTSMAAPQMAGCIAILRGAARKEGLQNDPVRMDRALRLSATPLDHHAWVEQGHGFIDMVTALDALRLLDEAGLPEQTYKVVARNQYGDGAGIYLRGLASERPLDVQVSITPDFEQQASNASKADFLHTFRPIAEASWVDVPDLFYASAQGKTIPVRIRPEGLEPGLHSTRVLIFDVDRPDELGPEIILPVTVIVPEQTYADEDHRYLQSVELTPGQLHRTFLTVPAGATQARIKVTQWDGGRNEIRAGAGTVSGFTYPGDHQRRARYFLEDGEIYQTTVPVEVGTIFEYALASRWSTNSRAEFELDIQFVGLVPQQSQLLVPTGQEMAYLAVQDLLQGGNYQVHAEVQGVALPVLAPIEISPDPIRAQVMGEHGIFQGTRSFPVEIPAGGASVTLHMPASIQTIELREDLMLYVRDVNGQILHRLIAYEIDTPIGKLDPGTFQFDLVYPSIGVEALQSAYAGAEIRLQTGGGSLQVAATLQDGLSGEGGSTLRIPFGGTRTAFMRVPKLAPLDHGAYYYGRVRFVQNGEDVLNVPIKIERPTGPSVATETVAPADPDSTAKDANDSDPAAKPTPSVPEAGPSAGSSDAVTSPNSTANSQTPASPRETYLASLAQAGTEKGDVARLQAARAWNKASPHDYQAELAVYRSLAEAGLLEKARHQARGFLHRHPLRIAEFLEAARSWNPQQ
jgi:tripeptidyl-peptidase II